MISSDIQHLNKAHPNASPTDLDGGQSSRSKLHNQVGTGQGKITEKKRLTRA